MRKSPATISRLVLLFCQVLCACLALQILAGPAAAQLTGSINGTVVDTTHAAIPGAKGPRKNNCAFCRGSVCARTRACRVGTYADAFCRRPQKRRDESTRHARVRAPRSVLTA